MSTAGLDHRASTRMWEHLKTSKHVLWEYYHVFGQQWVHIYKDPLMALTGKSERAINDILQAYRSEDHANGVKIKQQKYSPDQVAVLFKAFDESPYADSNKITEIADKTGLMRNQISTWFSRERKICAGQIRRRHRQLKKKETVKYFSIENILSDDFPKKK